MKSNTSVFESFLGNQFNEKYFMQILSKQFLKTREIFLVNRSKVL